MKNVTSFMLQTDDEDRKINIHVVDRICPNGNSKAVGVFGLSEGNVSRGEIIFDDAMNQWEYTGIGDLSHNEASEIANFIKENQQELIV